MLFHSAFADERVQTYSGIINRKPWTKSYESFCAGGSDFLVLETPTGPKTIASNRGVAGKVSRDELMRLVGKNVTVEAASRNITVKCDMMHEQCVSPETNCTYLEVLRVIK